MESSEQAVAQIVLRPIGVVHSSFTSLEGMPIQAAASEATGTIEVYPEFVEGLADLDGFDHLIVLYRFHLAARELLSVTPFLDDVERGVFATRAPIRPNRIGLSVVRLERIAGRVLHIANVDMASGTPVLDIKPYVPAFDFPGKDGRIGWFEATLGKLATTRADDRMR